MIFKVLTAFLQYICRNKIANNYFECVFRIVNVFKIEYTGKQRNLVCLNAHHFIFDTQKN